MFSKSKLKIPLSGCVVFIYLGLLSLSVSLGNIIYLVLNGKVKNLLEFIVSIQILPLSIIGVYSYIKGRNYSVTYDTHLYIIKIMIGSPFIGASISSGVVSMSLILDYYIESNPLYLMWGIRLVLISIAFSIISISIFYIGNIVKHYNRR